MKDPDGLSAVGLHDLAAGFGELGLVLAQAGVHLRRLADVLGAELAGVAAARHLLACGRTGLRERERRAAKQDNERDINGFRHGSPFDALKIRKLQFRSGRKLIEAGSAVHAMFMAPRHASQARPYHLHGIPPHAAASHGPPTSAAVADRSIAGPNAI